jgi:ribonucleotide reductase beta subunit family protein with ferritin-like domain
MLSQLTKRFLDVTGGNRFQLSTEIQNHRIARLYTKAKRDQWNLDEKDYFPAETLDREELNQWLGIDEELRLAAARTFSSFYYGEQGAKLISAQLSIEAPTLEAQKFLATQTMDEARHVETFEKILNLLNEIQPINPFLNALLADIYRTPLFAEKLVGMNLLVEGLALSAFRATTAALKPGQNISENGFRAVGEPIQAIIRDESRHVGFGVILLKDVLTKLNRRQQIKLRLRQAWWLCLLYGSVKYHQKDQELLGIDYLSLLNTVIADHERRLAECGADTLLSTRKMTRMIPAIDKIVDQLRR